MSEGNYLSLTALCSGGGSNGICVPLEAALVHSCQECGLQLGTTLAPSQKRKDY